MPTQRRSGPDTDGFSLLELLIGSLILFLILGGSVLVARNASTSTPQSRDLSDYSSRLSDFVDSIRNYNNLNPNALPKNSQQLRISASPVDTVRWYVYDNTSAAPYTQPAGLFLLTAKLTWKKQGRVHAIETSTLLNQQ